MIFEKAVGLLKEKGLTVTFAESCTGGLVSSYLTDVSGASAYIFQNFVTYSNEAKNKILGVKKSTLDKYGAVSENTAYEMSEGLLNWADTSVATTGILGPTGGSKEKPVGLCFISLGIKINGKKEIKVIKYNSKAAATNSRTAIKQDIVDFALLSFLDFLKEKL